MSERGRVVALLNRRRRPISPSQRRVAEYVLRQYQDVAFMSVTQLAKAAKVSPAGVVRFSTDIRSSSVRFMTSFGANCDRTSD
jgi:DNA-binding MurR/RpiR family transcriptional regulator